VVFGRTYPLVRPSPASLRGATDSLPVETALTSCERPPEQLAAHHEIGASVLHSRRCAHSPVHLASEARHTSRHAGFTQFASQGALGVYSH